MSWFHPAKATLALLACVTGGAASAEQPLYGFTAFPFDLTTESEDKVHAIIRKHANLFAIHMDQCLPWVEAIAGAPYPDWLEQTWKQVRARIPLGQTVYLAMTPTDIDRQSMAPACGKTEDTPAPHPKAISGKPFDDPAVIDAYVRYLRRNIDFFKPSYVNVGIEMSELSLRKPDGWPAFQRLYIASVAALKQSHPDVRVGIELALQSLLDPRVAAQVRPAVDASDFMCLSFYPYAANAAVKLWGAPPLPPPPDQWRTPLDWVRSYTDKPLAMCETGYSTQDVTFKSYGVTLPGTADQQLQFVKDLVERVERDKYLFVVWFITVDYERLMRQMPGAQDWMWIWAYTGLFNSNLTPKPALSAWPLPK